MLPDCLGVPIGARLASFESSPAAVFGVFGTGVSVIDVVVAAGIVAAGVVIFSAIGVFGIGVDGKRGINGETGTASFS